MWNYLLRRRNLFHLEISFRDCGSKSTYQAAKEQHGRNIHQKETDEAVRMNAACHAIICEGATVDEALAIYQG